MSRDLVLLLARVALSAVFLYSGIDKLVGWPAAVREAQVLGLPNPALAMAATIAVQIVGGCGVLTGLWFRLCAGVLAGFTICATLLAHWPLDTAGHLVPGQLTTSLEHLGMVGGFVAAIVVGPGRLSLKAPHH